MSTSILSQLSSQVGDRTNGANHQVVELCKQNPALLKEIEKGFSSKDKKLQADCGEVMTQMAEAMPEEVVPYAAQLISNLDGKNGRMRWEAMHAIALIAHLIPKTIGPLLGKLSEILRKDDSIIVRDYATETIKNYAGSGKLTSREAFPYLIEILDQWGEKHASRVLEGLLHVYEHHPDTRNEIVAQAEKYVDARKGVARKAAQKIIKKAGRK